MRLCKHGKKVLYCFYKIFLQKQFDKWREILFIYFLIEIDVLSTRSGQSFLLLANENAHLTTHEPIKICVIKVKSSWNRVDGEFSFEFSWILQKNTEHSVKTRRNVQNIRFWKERTSRWGVYLSWKWMSLCMVALESYVNLPDVAAWDGQEVESLIVPCEVLLFRNHSTSSGSRLWSCCW